MAARVYVANTGRQLRDGWRARGLRGIEAIIERQQGMLAEGDDDCLFGFDLGVFGPIRASLVKVLRFHLTTVFSVRRANALMLS